MSHGELMIEPGFRPRSYDAKACTFHHCGTVSHWGVCTQLCPTLCGPMDCSPPGSSVHGIFQARILAWAAVSSSRASSQPRDWSLISCVSCIGRRILGHCTTWGAPLVLMCKLYFLSFYVVFLLSHFVSLPSEQTIMVYTYVFIALRIVPCINKL